LIIEKSNTENEGVKMDTISENRLREIFPLLADKVRNMASALETEGVIIRVVQSLRTWADQSALYLKGRDEKGQIIDRTAVVTNCPGGKSYHNFGLAVDCVPSTYGNDHPFDPDWNSDHEVWKKMISAGLSVGLQSGAAWRTFPDFPHFQLTGQFPENEPSIEVHELYRSGGLQAVWEEVRKNFGSSTL
jgi:peptidoglycan LD-endopeptidase CwlK